MPLHPRFSHMNGTSMTLMRAEDKLFVSLAHALEHGELLESRRGVKFIWIVPPSVAYRPAPPFFILLHGNLSTEIWIPRRGRVPDRWHSHVRESKGSRTMRVPTLIQSCNEACVSAVHSRRFQSAPANTVRAKVTEFKVESVFVLEQIWLKKDYFLLTEDVDLLNLWWWWGHSSCVL